MTDFRRRCSNLSPMAARPGLCRILKECCRPIISIAVGIMQPANLRVRSYRSLAWKTWQRNCGGEDFSDKGGNPENQESVVGKPANFLQLSRLTVCGS